MNPVTPKMPNCIVQYRPSVICETNSTVCTTEKKTRSQQDPKYAEMPLARPLTWLCWVSTKANPCGEAALSRNLQAAVEGEQGWQQHD
jgi:hypothetical protein